MKYTIDRFEDKYAILEDENKTMHTLTIAELPLEVKAGDVLDRKQDGGFVICGKETTDKRSRNKARLSSLFNR